MKVEVTEDYGICLKEVYNSVLLETSEGNQISICMRDDTFEMFVIPKGKDLKWFRVDMQKVKIIEMSKHNVIDHRPKLLQYGIGIYRLIPIGEQISGKVDLNIDFAIDKARLEGEKSGREKEREACALVGDKYKCSKCEVSYDGFCPCHKDANKIASAIRNRSERNGG